jgi:stage II sporulation protein GA (sporulation sigma-E factor processing peptidase)
MIYPNVIYIDTLVIINLYVNFFLIKACGVFSHRRISTPRCILGAAAGGVSSLVILLPPMPALPSIAMKLFIGGTLVLIAFGAGKFIRNALIFLVINVVFAGLMLVLSLFASPLGMVYNNGVVYFDISFLALVFSTTAAYFLIRALRYFMDVKFNTDKLYAVSFSYMGKSRELSAFADSGNTLTDFFTGKPVIICDKSACDGIFPELECLTGDYDVIPGLRFLPYSTVGGSGLLPVFKPESVRIGNKRVNALIGISKEGINKDGVNAIFNPKLLI